LKLQFNCRYNTTQSGIQIKLPHDKVKQWTSSKGTIHGYTFLNVSLNASPKVAFQTCIFGEPTTKDPVKSWETLPFTSKMVDLMMGQLATLQEHVASLTQRVQTLETWETEEQETYEVEDETADNFVGFSQQLTASSKAPFAVADLEPKQQFWLGKFNT